MSSGLFLLLRVTFLFIEKGCTLINMSGPIANPPINPKICAAILMFGWIKVMTNPMKKITFTICALLGSIKCFRKNIINK